MSRIGKMPITVPAGVEVTIADGNVVTVKGPKGTLTSKFHHDMIIKQEGAVITVSRPDDEHAHKSLHGLTRTLRHNMVVGDGKGTVGYGLGKAAEVSEAILKGIANAKKNLHKVTLSGTTIPHEVIGIYGAGSVLMKPASVGTGVIAGGAVRAVMEAVGITNIRTKCLRSNNPQNVVKATMQGLLSLRGPEEVARIRGKSVEEIIG